MRLKDKLDKYKYYNGGPVRDVEFNEEDPLLIEDIAPALSEDDAVEIVENDIKIDEDIPKAEARDEYTDEDLREQLKFDEGYAKLVQDKSKRIGKSDYGSYLDELGKPTTGIGHLITDKTQELVGEGVDYNELTEEQANQLFDKDVKSHTEGLYKLLEEKGIDKDTLNSNQLGALKNMYFQLGHTKMGRFKDMLGAIKDGDYEKAQFEITDSIMGRDQTAKRAKRVADLFGKEIETKQIDNMVMARPSDLERYKALQSNINEEKTKQSNDIMKTREDGITQPDEKIEEQQEGKSEFDQMAEELASRDIASEEIVDESKSGDVVEEDSELKKLLQTYKDKLQASEGDLKAAQWADVASQIASQIDRASADGRRMGLKPTNFAEGIRKQMNTDRKSLESLILKMEDAKKKGQLTPYQEQLLQVQKDRLAQSKESADLSRKLRQDKETRLVDQKAEDRRLRADDKIYKVTKDFEGNALKKRLDDQEMSFDQMDTVMQRIKEGNQIAVGVLGAKAARTLGGEVGVLTDGDIKRYVEAQSVVRKLQDKYGKAWRGRMSDKTLNAIEEISDKMLKGFEKKKRQVYDRYVDRAYKSYGKQAGLTRQEVEDRFGIRDISRVESVKEDRGSKKEKDEHSEAIKWAKANPNDPRAKEILKTVQKFADGGLAFLPEMGEVESEESIRERWRPDLPPLKPEQQEAQDIEDEFIADNLSSDNPRRVELAKRIQEFANQREQKLPTNSEIELDKTLQYDLEGEDENRRELARRVREYLGR